MRKNKSLGKTILIIFVIFFIISFIGTLYVDRAVELGEMSIFEDVFGIETSFPLLLIMIFLALVIQFLPFVIFFGFIIFIVSFFRKMVEQNNGVIEKNIRKNTSTKKISSIKTSHDIHVSKGSPEDSFIRRTTGESLHKDDCKKCEELEPWDTPKESRFRGFLTRMDNDIDDVEAYYRERGMKKKK